MKLIMKRHPWRLADGTEFCRTIIYASLRFSGNSPNLDQDSVKETPRYKSCLCDSEVVSLGVPLSKKREFCDLAEFAWAEGYT
jgi:hypothetical protein